MSERTDADDLPDPLEAVVEDFLACCRRGERPSVDACAARYPELAERIRALFPTLAELEGCAWTPSLPCRPAPLRQDAAPAALGPFRALRELGRGGMGVVYEAVQGPLGRRVALKVLAAELSQKASYRERFEREAMAAAGLHHTNIVPVFASGEQDGTLYFAMQLIDGQSLAVLLAGLRGEGRPATQPSTGFATEVVPATRPVCCPPAGHVRRMAGLGMQAAEALAHAHRHGLLHRDVKPANLLVDGQETLWVADFGLAKAEGANDLTGTGEVVGTLRYLAPERFRGQCDARSDVYALGATLYEMLALRPAFAEPDRLELLREIGRGAAPLRRTAPWVPADLATVVHKALAVGPAERYGTAQELADDLRRFLDDVPVRARRASAMQRLRRWARRNPVTAGLTGTVVLLLALLAVGSTVATLWLRSALATADQARDRAEDHLGRSLLDQARALRQSGAIGQRTQGLRLLREAAGRCDRAELRDAVIASLALADLEEARRAPAGALGGASVYDFHLEKGLAARDEPGAEVSVRRLDDGIELGRLPAVGGRGLLALHFSPDGRFLVQQGRDDGARLWDVTGPQPRLVVKIADLEPGSDVAFDPSGRRMVCVIRPPATPANALVVHDVAGGAELCRVRLPFTLARHVVAMHSSGRLAVASQRKVHVIDLERGKIQEEIDQPWQVAAIVWGPREGYLAVAAQDGRIRIWNVAAPKAAVLVLEGLTAGSSAMAWGPGGQALLARDGNAVLRIWDLGSGRQVLAARDIAGHFHGPDGMLAVLQGRELVLYRLVLPAVLRALGDYEGEGPFHFSPSGGMRPFSRAVLDGTGRWLAGGTATLATHAGASYPRLVLADLSAPLWTPTQLIPDQLPVGFDVSGALLTSCSSGPGRWPFWPGPLGGARCRLGPMERAIHGIVIGPPPASGASADGVLWAVPLADGLYLCHRGQAGPPLRLRFPGCCCVAVRCDGGMVAAGSSRAPGGGAVKVWAPDGRLLRELPLERAAQLAFSPEGDRLAAADGDRVRQWDLSTWEEGPSFAGDACAWAPGGVLAVRERRIVGLVTAATGAVLARLDLAYEASPQPLCLSPDGAVLAVAGGETRALYLWDLRALRQELAAWGLDWDGPPLPPHKPFQPPGPIQLTIDLAPPK